VIAQYIWRPGGVASATVLTTWAAVEAAITANLGSVLILTDASLGALIVPAAASTECYGRAAFAPYDAGVGGADIQFADTAQIRNPASFRNTTLRGAPTSINFLVLDIPNIQCVMQEGSSIVLELGATVPAVHADVPGGQCQLVLLRGSTIVNQTGNAALAVVFIDATVQLIFAIVACVQAPLIGGCYPANAFSGGLTASLIILADASAPLVLQPNLASAIFSVVPDVAVGVAYDDSLVLPPLGAANVQDAIDALKPNAGTYTPTLTIVSNVNSATANRARWSRVGNIVTVLGSLDFDATVANTLASALEISLPVPSLIPAVDDLSGSAVVEGGTAAATNENAVGVIRSNLISQALLTIAQPQTTATRACAFQFSYEVLP
jgi:hypothetical protein